MNQIIQTQLDGVETALATLIDSIASYNPSVSAAQDLLAADDALSKGLEKLQTHQRNHTRLLSLRAAQAAQTETLQATVTLLANTRASILEAQTPSRTPTRRVPIAELLAYAQNQSRYGTPPPTQQQPQNQTQPKSQSQSQILTNGSAPLDASASAPQEPEQEPGPEQEAETNPEPQSQALSLTLLTAPELSWLNPDKSSLPWPSEEAVRLGGLAHVQGLMERGLDVLAGEDLELAGGGGRGGGVEMDVEMVEVGRGDQAGDRNGNGDVRKGSEWAVDPRGSSGGAEAGEGRREKEKEKPGWGGLELYNPDAE